MRIFEQLINTPIWSYTVVGLLLFFILIWLMFFFHSFAPVGVFLYILKPVIDLGYKYKLAGINLQSVTITLFLAALALYNVFNNAEKKSNEYKLALSLLIGYALWITFSTLLHNPSAEIIPDLLKAIIIVPIFFGGYVYFFDLDRRLKNMIMFLCVINLITCLGYLQLAEIIPYDYNSYIGGKFVYRVTCAYKHPGDYMNYIIIGLSFILFLNSEYKHRGIKIFVWGSFIFWLPIIYYTYLRSTYVVLIIMVLLDLFFRKKYSELICFLCFLCLLCLLFSEKIYEIFYSTFRALENEDYRSLGHGRLGLIQDLIGYLFNNPKMFFTGYGALPVINTEIINDAHNDYLKVLFESGIVGFFLFYSFVLLCIKQAVICVKKHPISEERGMGRIMLILCVGMAFYGLTTRPSDYPTILLFVFSMASYIFISYHKAYRGRISTLE